MGPSEPVSSEERVTTTAGVETSAEGASDYQPDAAPEPREDLDLGGGGML